ncbi:MAG: branched-chain amino acid ABC transporter permease [Acidimicrobiales bacterium]
MRRLWPTEAPAGAAALDADEARRLIDRFYGGRGRMAARILLGVVLMVAAWAPTFWLRGSAAYTFTLIVPYAVAILGLNLLTGYGGLISLGHSAFFGFGAYACALFFSRWGWPTLLSVAGAAVFCFGVGALVGLPALRIKGLYLALITLSISVVFPTVIKRFDWLTRGNSGISLRRMLPAPDWTGLSVTEVRIWKHGVVVLVGALMFVLAAGLMASAAGRAIRAVSENETAAAVSGINVKAVKTLTFATSASFAGVGGALFAIEAEFVAVSSFDMLLSIKFYTAMVLGGLASILGAVPGAAIMVALPALLERRGGGGGFSAGVIYGLALVLLTFRLPGGIASIGRWLIERFRRDRLAVYRDHPEATSVTPPKR